MKKSKSYYAIFILIGILLFFPVNVFIISNLIIGDPCKWHNATTSKLFDLFFEMTSGNGYHPEPTIFNIIFFMIIGGYVGHLFACKRNKKIAGIQ